MLAITLGTQASGSTWLYNVVRLLCEMAGEPVFSASADDAVDFLDQLPVNPGDVVLKAHALDQRLVKLARLANAKFLVSTRDPRDSVVSQRERFGSTVHQASVDLSRAFATIRSLPIDLPMLQFAYEDRFTEQPETIAQVASFLGIAVDDFGVAEIFDSLGPESVRSRIADRSATFPPGADPGHDPVTRWHPLHIGDGKTGKWRERLDVATQDIVSGCLNAMASLDLSQGKPLKWSAELFTCSAGLPERPTVELSNRGEAEALSWGPYLCIPRGRWRAMPLVRGKGLRRAKIVADIFLPWEDRSVAECRERMPHTNAPALILDFDHHDYFQPVEARLRGVEGSCGDISFSGWKLFWMGSLS